MIKGYEIQQSLIFSLFSLTKIDTMENPYKPLNFLSEGKRDNIYIYIYSCEIPKEGGVRMRLGIVVVFVVVGLALLGSAQAELREFLG